MKYYVTTSVLFLFGFLFGMPHVADAQSGGAGTGGTSGGPPPQIVKLENPLKVGSIPEFFALLIDVLLIFAVPIIVFFIIYAGFLFVTARGNEDQIKKAKNALLWTVIGAVLLLGAKTLLAIIINTVDQLRI